jgi:hypothetical protein
LDIYLPENKLAIEYNSLYWHSSQSSDNTIFIKNRLLNKLLKCQDLGIRLLQFWDCEWINKKDICKEIILFALGKIAKRIPAQKCTLKEISSKEANVFLKENHIQGRCRSNYRLGLSLNNQLVGIQCYQAPNPGGDSRNSWLIVRTAFLKNVQVIGGISRMFKKFIETIQPEQVVDYTDRRLFIASGHYAMKFNRLGVTRPCGYLTDGTSLYSRRHYRHWGKHHFRFKMPWDDALTDTENLANNGWWWVWDCGKIKNVWKRSL